MSEALKPCPFCGADAHMINDHAGTWIRCKQCYAETAFHDSALEAIAAWNRRASDRLDEEGR